jgi:hypothetical protein
MVVYKIIENMFYGILSDKKTHQRLRGSEGAASSGDRGIAPPPAHYPDLILVRKVAP